MGNRKAEVVRFQNHSERLIEEYMNVFKINLGSVMEFLHFFVAELLSERIEITFTLMEYI